MRICNSQRYSLNQRAISVQCRHDDYKWQPLNRSVYNEDIELGINAMVNGENGKPVKPAGLGWVGLGWIGLGFGFCAGTHDNFIISQEKFGCLQFTL